MPRFNQQELFNSGPTRFHVGGLHLRHDDQPTPHLDGTTLVSHGRSARPITQTGTLLADDTDRMALQLAAIEQQLDGLAHTLIDNTGRVWEQTAMLRFEPGPLRKVGPRCRVDYTIDYLQVNP
ncbi:MAG: hypothetical protein AAF333_16915 [Planctomycetota bacterium]